MRIVAVKQMFWHRLRLPFGTDHVAFSAYKIQLLLVQKKARAFYVAFSLFLISITQGLFNNGFI